jgi:hypothetical protein
MLIAFLPVHWLLAAATSQLPDLTQPSQLVNVASGFGLGLLLFAGLAIGLGIALALINFALKPQQGSAIAILDRWTIRYTELLALLQKTALIGILAVFLFLGCSTLANRYSFWEQSKFGGSNTVTNAVEQVGPEIEYTTTEPYSYNTQLNGKVVKVQDSRAVKKTMSPIGSNIRVKIASTNVKQVAEVNFVGEYQVKNTAPADSTLLLKMSPPQGFGLVQNFVVEKDGQRLLPSAGQSYNFPLSLAPNSTSQLRVSYRGQGVPRWMYRVQGQLISKLQLAIETDLSNMDAIGGLVPTQVENRGLGRVLTWVFTDNVSVNQGFGAGTTFVADRQSGILPRLLTLAPAAWLWWLMLLLLSLPLGLKDIAVSAGAFFAAITALTYGSRLIRTDFISPYLTAPTLWLGITGLLMLLGIGLARQRRTAIGVALSAIVGLVLPILGLLSAYSGAILGLAGLLSLGWLATPRWYGRPRQLKVAKVSQDENQPLLDSGNAESLDRERLNEEVTSPEAST